MKRMISHAAWLSLFLASATFAEVRTVPAFPGAEGFGAGATGGRGGEVYVVTNLDDSGKGSLRDAVSQPNRTVIFAVSGTIKLDSRLEIKQPNITIAGQTAPGGGICLRQHELMIKDTQNIIVRYLRIRPGDEAKQEMDAVTVWNSKDVIIDHCSMSWSTDSLNDVVKLSGNVTVQWCMLSEPLNESVHIKGSHGYATGWDGRTKGGGTFHHNLIAHAASRAPRIGYNKVDRGQIDCRNNVIYNSGPSYGGETDDFNYVANYYRPGPETEKRRPTDHLFEVWSADSRMFASGNVYEGKAELNSNSENGVVFKAAKNANGETQKGDPQTCLVKEPFKMPPVATDTAEVAYARVVESAGATLPARDAVDQRIAADVRNRTGRIINSPYDVGGWPELKSVEAPKDTDQDGMPDDWETSHNLDPSSAADGAKITDTGYSNRELYLNSLVAKP